MKESPATSVGVAPAGALEVPDGALTVEPEEGVDCTVDWTVLALAAPCKHWE